MLSTKLTPAQIAAWQPTPEMRAADQALKPDFVSQEVWDEIGAQIDQEQAVEMADMYKFMVENYPDEMTAAQADIRPPAVHDESVMTPL